MGNLTCGWQWINNNSNSTIAIIMGSDYTIKQMTVEWINVRNIHFICAVHTFIHSSPTHTHARAHSHSHTSPTITTTAEPATHIHTNNHIGCGLKKVLFFSLLSESFLGSEKHPQIVTLAVNVWQWGQFYGVRFHLRGRCVCVRKQQFQVFNVCAGLRSSSGVGTTLVATHVQWRTYQGEQISCGCV